MSALAHVALARSLSGEDLYHCTTCELYPAMKEALGHDGPPTNYWSENLISGEELMLCPVRQLQLADPKLVEEVQRHRLQYRPLMKEYGVMIEDGGIADQPARSLDLLAAIDHADVRAQLKRDEVRERNRGMTER